MKVLVTFAILCALQRDLAQAVGSGYVNYSRQDKWGGKCNTGYQQSPINIDTNHVIQDKNLPKLKLENLNKKMSAIATNIGYAVEFNFTSDKGDLIRVSGAGLDGSFVLNNMYYHWPSEHTINKRHLQLEAHWVCYSDKYSCLEDAYKDRNGVVYLATLYFLGTEHKNIEELADAVQSVAKRVGSKTVLKSFKWAAPKDDWSFYKYHGSRPVPPCTESVNWIILKEPISISEEQYKKITTVLNSDGKRIQSNNRRTQPLNGRKVYYRLK